MYIKCPISRHKEHVTACVLARSKECEECRCSKVTFTFERRIHGISGRSVGVQQDGASDASLENEKRKSSPDGPKANDDRHHRTGSGAGPGVLRSSGRDQDKDVRDHNEVQERAKAPNSIRMQGGLLRLERTLPGHESDVLLPGKQAPPCMMHPVPYREAMSLAVYKSCISCADVNKCPLARKNVRSLEIFYCRDYTRCDPVVAKARLVSIDCGGQQVRDLIIMAHKDPYTGVPKS